MLTSHSEALCGVLETGCCVYGISLDKEQNAEAGGVGNLAGLSGTLIDSMNSERRRHPFSVEDTTSAQFSSLYTVHFEYNFRY